MKKIVVLLFVLAGALCIQETQAQVVLEGEQIARHGQNAELKCNPVVLTKDMKITKIDGFNKGFWIEKEGSGAIHKFWDLNDPKAKNTVLKAGKYWVYPNLQQGKSTAKVTLTLQ